MMWWVLALLGLGAVVASGGASGKQPQRTPTPTPPPQPQGAQPDPDAPEDPDRGRFDVVYGIPFDDAQASVREADILQLADTAEGFIVVDMLINDTHNPKRCVSRSWRLAVVDGQVDASVSLAAKRVCAKPGLPLKSSPPQYDGPEFEWYSQGPTLVMRTTTRGRGLGVNEDDAPFFSPEQYGSTSLYIDLRWRFE